METTQALILHAVCQKKKKKVNLKRHRLNYNQQIINTGVFFRRCKVHAAITLPPLNSYEIVKVTVILLRLISEAYALTSLGHPQQVGHQESKNLGKQSRAERSSAFLSQASCLLLLSGDTDSKQHKPTHRFLCK